MKIYIYFIDKLVMQKLVSNCCNAFTVILYTVDDGVYLKVIYVFYDIFT